MENKEDIVEKHHHNNYRIVSNSLILYLRLILTLIIALYTSRQVLLYLGVDDFGIYTVVGGVVTMMTFITGSMSSANQRFFSYDLGKGDKVQLSKTFCMSLNIHFILVLVIVVFGETLGLYIVNNVLVIPTERLFAANVVYQCSILAFCFSVIAIPFNAIIVAEERISAYAIISIADVSLKLFAVLLLGFGFNDNLQVYGVLTMSISFAVMTANITYYRLKLKYENFYFYWDGIIFNRLVGYTGWSLFGNLASVLSVQGVNILLNIFFGAAVNAARAISFQVFAAVNSFVSSILVSINPQIIKAYANGESKRFESLVFVGSKISFFVLLVLTLPLIFQMDIVLSFWLLDVPKGATLFCQLILIDALIASISGTLMTAVQATGKIKSYQIVIGGIYLLNLPVSYLFLSYGYDAYIVMLVSIALSVFALLCRLLMLNMIFGFNIDAFCKLVIIKVVLVSSVSIAIISLVLKVNFEPTVKFIFVSIISILSVLFSAFVLGCTTSERAYLINGVKKLKSRSSQLD
ncbi:TPA: lipopolysaccharide biosynthesis protein [Vibrio vulnificus]|nr:lipopolysaccharide biosynthesis protein [Vibrio vulnificus]